MLALALYMVSQSIFYASELDSLSCMASNPIVAQYSLNPIKAGLLIPNLRLKKAYKAFHPQLKFIFNPQ